jgi:uncharacterized oxidoreductase
LYLVLVTAQTLPIRAADVRAVGRSILVGLGAADDAATVVADHVIDAHIMGLESHGAIRIVQYARDIRSGRIHPAGVPVVAASTSTTAVIDGQSTFGQVTATMATDIAVEKARASSIAVVGTRGCNHVGRLGAYVERAARQGVVAIAVAAIPRLGHFVVPAGGRDGRLGTNPIAYGFPTTGDPIVADFATSVIPEGRIRTALNKGVPLTDDAVLDANGAPTRDPAAFYGPPMGTILPVGGAVSHKGYAISMLVELLGAALLGDHARAEDRSINGFTMIAIALGALTDDADVRAAADDLVAYVRSSRAAPDKPPVVVPGQPEFEAQRRAGADPVLQIDLATWAQIVEVAASLEIPVPAPLAAPAAEG